MPFTRAHVKKTRKLAAIIIAIMITLVAIGLLFSNLFDNTDCQQYNYNSKLNGGVKIFETKKYNINICGSGVNNSHFSGDSMDVVQLTVTDDQGDVLAKRRYKVFWDAKPGHEPIAIGRNSITYQDDEKQRDYTIPMPPTFLEWIRARVTFF